MDVDNGEATGAVKNTTIYRRAGGGGKWAHTTGCMLKDEATVERGYLKPES